MPSKLWSLVVGVLLVSVGAVAADGPRVLFLNKSAGFEHSVVKVENDAPCYVETIVRPLIEDQGGTLTSTKDGGVLTAENLKNFDVVMFYTTEDLCRSDSGDMTPAAGPDAMMDLLEWIQAGGGFLGFHCASDTWHRERNQFAPESPYLDMLGGEFRSHGAQFEGTLKVVDPEHPTMAHVKDGWRINDEWYLFSGLQDETMHVLALLEPGEEREKQEKYQVPAYPVIWCSAPGEGRVFYNAMGHREDVWSNPDFQQLFLDSLAWTNGVGEAGAAPNFSAVVPGDLDPATGAGRAVSAAADTVSNGPDAPRDTEALRERREERRQKQKQQ